MKERLSDKHILLSVLFYAVSDVYYAVRMDSPRIPSTAVSALLPLRRDLQAETRAEEGRVGMAAHMRGSLDPRGFS